MSQSPKSIVQNGKPVFGTFSDVPVKLDIRGLKRPFAGIPLPSLFTNFRIKSRIAYMFSLGSYIGMIEFFDDKMFGLAEVIFWNRETGKKLVYHSFMTTRRRFVPIKLDNAACVSYRKTRYIRIFWSRKYDRFSMTFDLKAKSGRPPVKAVFVSRFSDPLFAETLSVTPAPTMQRCSASWLSAMPIYGSLNILAGGSSPESIMGNDEGLAFMVMNRAYYKYHTKSEMMCGLGEYEGRKLLFRLISTSMDPAGSEQYSENTLVLNGKITTMPPVCITHPFGTERNWVVQDTEAMVDLTFTPVSVNRRTLNILIMRTDYDTIYGTFEGVVLTGTGEKITLKNFPGIVKKNLLRV